MLLPERRLSFTCHARANQPKATEATIARASSQLDHAAGRGAAKHADVPLPDRRGECDGCTMPRLILPTTLVRDSHLQGETDTAMEEGLPTDWLEEAAADFAASSPNAVPSGSCGVSQ
jgi:hypothetical protein